MKAISGEVFQSERSMKNPSEPHNMVNEADLEEWTKQTRQQIETIRRVNEVNRMYEQSNEGGPVTESEI